MGWGRWVVPGTEQSVASRIRLLGSDPGFVPSSCVTLGNLLILCVAQFCHVYNEVIAESTSKDRCADYMNY